MKIITAPNMSGMIAPLLTQVNKSGFFEPMMAEDSTNRGKHVVRSERTLATENREEVEEFSDLTVARLLLFTTLLLLAWCMMMAIVFSRSSALDLAGLPRRPVVTIKSDCDLCNLLVLGKSRVQSLREGPQVVKAILCFVPYSLQCCDVVARELNNNDISTGTFENVLDMDTV